MGAACLLSAGGEFLYNKYKVIIKWWTNFSSLCLLPVQSMEDLEDQKRKKKKEKMTLGSLSRVFARGKQRKSLDPGLFDGTSTPDYYIEEDADW